MTPLQDSLGNPYYVQYGPEFATDDAHRLTDAPVANLPTGEPAPHWYAQLRAKEHLYSQLDFDHRHEVYVVRYPHLDGMADLWFSYRTGAWCEAPVTKGV